MGIILDQIPLLHPASFRLDPLTDRIHSQIGSGCRDPPSRLRTESGDLGISSVVHLSIILRFAISHELACEVNSIFREAYISIVSCNYEAQPHYCSHDTSYVILSTSIALSSRNSSQCSGV